MKIKTIRKEQKFIPDFCGNKDLPEEEQIVVNIKKFPTITEANGYRSYKVSEGGGVEVVYPNDSVMLARHIGSIKNIDIEDADPEEPKITNGSSLGKSTVLELSSLISEIRDYLLEASEAIESGEK